MKSKMKSGTLLFAGLIFAGCSNAPPIGYSNIPSEKHFGKTISFKPNFLQKINTVRDTALYERSGGAEGHPEWTTLDMFYMGLSFSPSFFDLGFYFSNFYPGAYFGLKYKVVSANCFVTTTLELSKMMPGCQGSANLKGAILSYSRYMENVTSYMPNGAFIEAGPSKVGRADRYYLGYEFKEVKRAYGIGLFYNPTFMKGVSAIGIESSVSL